MSDGYQKLTGNGAKIRADVVDVYVFTRVERGGNDARERAAARQSTARSYESEAEWPAVRSGKKGEQPRHGGAESVQEGAPEITRKRSVVYFLQMLRAEPPLEGTWHPVMGHVEAGETSVQCAVREMREEVGLEVATALGFYALEQVHPFYIAKIDTVVMSPRFCVEVAPEWSPTLNGEHGQFRWVRETDVDELFMWPGQKAACGEVVREIVRDASVSREWLRISDFGLGISE